jgi:hypothetical protein
MKNTIFTIIAILFVFGVHAQVAIGTSNPDASAKFQIDATDKGFLAPRVALTSLTDNTTIASPATGLMVYCNGTGGLEEGFYYWNGSSWTKMSQVSNNQDLGYVVGWPSNATPPGYLLPLSGGTYNWVDYPEFQTFNDTYASQFIASSTATSFTLKDVNSTGRFLRGGSTAGTDQAGSTKLPVIPFAIGTAGAHVHSVDPPSTASSTDGAHSHTLHRRGNEDAGAFDPGNGRWSEGSASTTDRGLGLNAVPTSSAGSHAHTIDIAAFNSATNGDHTHTISGGDAETRPINTSIVWCIKVKPTAAAGNITINNVTGITSGSNGLTANPSNVKLGGTLSETTTIDKAGYDLDFTGTGNVEIMGNAAVGTITPDASAKLQVDATNQGALLPRLTQTQMNAIASPATGLVLYCTDCSPAGFRVYSGSSWNVLTPTPTLNTQTGIVLTATTTAPTTGTRAIDQITWEDCGNKVKLKYQLGMAGGTAGSGDYLFQLPTGMTFNTAANRNPLFNATLWSTGIANTGKSLIPASGGVVYSGSWSTQLYVVPYSSNTFRVISTWNNGAGLSAWSSGYFATVVDMVYTFEFEIWK